MAAAFDDIRLPEEIEQGSTGGPSFNTSIVRLNSGRETRNQNWQQQRMVYDVGYGITRNSLADGTPDPDDDDPSSFYAVMTFFYARRGRSRGFRFKDWTDYRAFAEPVAAVSSNANAVQLQKTYASGPIAYARRITRPNVGTVILASNGVPIDPATYAVDYTTGIVTFTGAAPANVTASFEFDVPVRFDTDVYTMTIQLWNAAEVQSLNIIEILE